MTDTTPARLKTLDHRILTLFSFWLLQACGRAPVLQVVTEVCSTEEPTTCFTVKVNRDSESAPQAFVAMTGSPKHQSNFNSPPATAEDVVDVLINAGLLPPENHVLCLTDLEGQPQFVAQPDGSRHLTSKGGWLTTGNGLPETCTSTALSVFPPEPTPEVVSSPTPHVTVTPNVPEYKPPTEQASLNKWAHDAVLPALGLMGTVLVSNLGYRAYRWLKHRRERSKPRPPAVLPQPRPTSDETVSGVIIGGDDLYKITNLRAKKLAEEALKAGKTGFTVHVSSDKGYYVV